MKNMKKILLTMVAAVLLVVMSVAGTLAYLVSTTDEVQNTFSVGNVKITLDEAPTDTDGKVIAGDRRITNDYHLLPGHLYAKDPTVHIDANSEDCYVFIKFYNGIANIEAADVEDDPTTEVDETKNVTIAAQMKAKGWHLVNGETDIYYYGTETAPTVVKAADKDLVIFENFTIDGELEAEDIDDYVTERDDDDKVTADAKNVITITAYAIQADGFDNADAATIWAAFDKQELGGN